MIKIKKKNCRFTMETNVTTKRHENPIGDFFGKN